MRRSAYTTLKWKKKLNWKTTLSRLVLSSLYSIERFSPAGLSRRILKQRKIESKLRNLMSKQLYTTRLFEHACYIETKSRVIRYYIIRQIPRLCHCSRVISNTPDFSSSSIQSLLRPRGPSSSVLSAGSSRSQRKLNQWKSSNTPIRLLPALLRDYFPVPGRKSDDINFFRRN